MVGNANAEQIEKQVLVFENARVLPIVEEGKVGVGLYKLDRDTCDLTDEAPYTDGCKTLRLPFERRQQPRRHPG